MKPRALRGLLCALALTVPAGVGAHPMGNFSISHYAAIRIEPDALRLRYLVDLAEIPTFQVLQESPLPMEPHHPAAQAYMARAAETLRDGLTLELDGRRLALQVESSDLILPPGAGGLPTLKIGVVYRATLAPAETAAALVLTYRDANYPGRAGWKEIVASVVPGVTLIESTAPEQDRSRELTDYPTDPAEQPAPGSRGTGRLRARGRPGLGRPPGPDAGKPARGPVTAGARRKRSVARGPSWDDAAGPNDAGDRASGGARAGRPRPGARQFRSGNPRPGRERPRGPARRFHRIDRRPTVRIRDGPVRPGGGGKPGCVPRARARPWQDRRGSVPGGVAGHGAARAPPRTRGDRVPHHRRVPARDRHALRLAPCRTRAHVPVAGCRVGRFSSRSSA